MSNVAKLKKQAADLELKKQFDKALAIYIKLLEVFDQHAAELDVALFNRVGDLLVRQGNVADAVEYYEQAVDRYTDTGFFNNAIALCNKILRASPGRASVYYKLGKISAQKGFNTDAKVNFLEYADRMQKSGKIDEAFRALKEFADLCPDQDDIRLMLADQLTKLDRKDEAIEQLQMLYVRYDGEGRSTEAMATAERMRAIDPSVEPRSADVSRKSSSSDLVFLDLDAPSSRPTPAAGDRRGASGQPARPAPPRPAPPAGLRRPVAPNPAPPPAAQPPAAPEMIIEPSQLDSLSDATADPLGGVTRLGDDAATDDAAASQGATLAGLESTHLSEESSTSNIMGGSILDIEPTSFGALDDSVVESQPSEASTPEDDEPLVIDLDISPGIGSEDDRSDPPDSGSSLDGVMLMDLQVPEPEAPPARAPSKPASAVTSGRTTPSATVGDFDLLEVEPDLPIPEDEVEDAAPEPPSPPAAAPSPRAPAPRAAPRSMAAAATPPARRPSVEVSAAAVPGRATAVAERSVELLRAGVVAEPERWALRRELGEAMLEAGDRAGGIRELETSMSGAEAAGDLDLAAALAEEVARLEPEQPRHHRKRVEYAFRMNDRGGLIEAYLSLADALLRADQPDKARTIYQRVIELAPDEVRAKTALETLAGAEPTSAPAAPARTADPRTGRSAPRPAADGDFVNLGDLLRDDHAKKDTRMIVAEQEPTGDEEADFADMLRKFKQGIAENVDAEDYQSHYDLAIAYKEMGLLDEAISEFQKALASPANRLPTYEALGQCFFDKGQFKLATSILGRGLSEPAAEDQLIGVLYLLGRAAEAAGDLDEALRYYHRVLVVDIQFRDIAERIAQLERAPR